MASLVTDYSHLILLFCWFNLSLAPPNGNECARNVFLQLLCTRHDHFRWERFNFVSSFLDRTNAYFLLTYSYIGILDDPYAPFFSFVSGHGLNRSY